ncbi:hypothetical protein PR048_014999 [Dryococelus australis]|uniref:SMP-30/Gluconolactonase/LRE-like region domain-containing protein n=1 Tax=Dryococelus australis TaxID=614101 RepID=A0ABQ9HFV3_9NEOP|nr:hypothetical protein PR048_014999 [Dryococelus australis]
MVKVEPVGDAESLGDSPHWDEKEQVLYFVDIAIGTVNKYDPVTKVQTSVKVGGSRTSLVVLVEGKSDKCVVSVERGIAVATWDGKSSKPNRLEALCVVHDKEGERENKFNDGKVDPTGRFWAANRRVAFYLKKNNLTGCNHDGMAIDTEGKLWVACMKGGQPIRVKRVEYGAAPNLLGWGKREIPENIRRQAASSGTIPT